MIRLFRAIVPAGVLPLMISEIVLICASFYAAAYILLQMDPAVYFLYEGGLVPLICALISILFAIYFSNLYSRIHVKSRIYLFQQMCQVIGLTLVAQSLIGYAHESWVMPRGLMIYGCAFALFGLFFWRMIYSASMQAMGAQRLLFVGTDPVLRDIAREIESAPERGYAVVGYIEDDDLPSLQRIVQQRHPDRIVVGLSERRHRMPVADLLELRNAGALIEEAGATYENICRRICSRTLQPARLIFRCDLNPAANSIWFQNAYNRLLALPAILLLSPVMLAIAIFLKARRAGPVLDRKARAGRNGHTFSMSRFHMEEGGFGRRFHLDALPELFNVLRGEMSLVGPRAERPEFAAALSERIPFYDYRHGVAPGMTGWAQINVPETETGPNSLLSLEYDLYYIKHMSLSLNAYILLHSLKSKLLSW